MENTSTSFRTPEEEIAYLRAQVAQKEQALQESKQHYEQGEVISGKIKNYAEQPPEKTLAPSHQMNNAQVEHVAQLSESLDHTESMTQLIAVLEEKGIKNTLTVVERMAQPDIADDFHKLLIQKIKAGLETPNIKESDPLWNVLRMTLYEVAMPEDKSQTAPSFKELVSAMEQFYNGMLSLAENKKKQYISVEFAIADKSHQIVMYMAVPDEQSNLFEKQMQSLFPSIQLKVQENDYNIFVPGGGSVAAVGNLRERGIYPIKGGNEFDHDPVNVILNAFSKIETEGGGAAMQIIFSPYANNSLGTKFKGALEKIKTGTPAKEATKIAYTTGAEIMQSVGGVLGDFMKPKKKPTDQPKPPDPQVIERISRKIETPIIATNIRFTASAQTEDRAKQILNELIASTNQFDDPQSNGFVFKEATKGKKLQSVLKQFSFREFNTADIVPLSLREFALLAHVPLSGISTSPQFKEAKSSGAPAPLDLPQEGTLLGTNFYRNVETKAYLTPKDRVRHLYVIGQTGTGKSVFLKNLVIQDIQAGDGVCYIDPHGTDIEDVLASVPEERLDDVVYFDPSASDGNVLGLNMLEYDPSKPEQKTFVINELFGIFKKLYSAESMGPIFEQYFRNATALVMEDPKTGNTLMDISRVMADAKYRALKLMRCQNPVIKQFWTEVATKAGGESSLQNMVPYITSKFDVFTANDIMRPIIAQEKSAFNFRQIMDERKILLVNLAKGRLGDINANLIGLILVGKLLMAALSRVDSMGKDFPPLYLYIDEFQNITTDSIEAILSEARKYKLSLNVAHQFIAQLEPGIRDAVFGNVGSMAVFRIGQEDAQFIENQFEGVFDMNSIMNIENYHAYVKILADGIPKKPFDIAVPPPFEGDAERGHRIKLHAATKYGYPRERVEKYIQIKYGTGDDADKPKPATAPTQIDRSGGASRPVASAPQTAPAVPPTNTVRQSVPSQSAPAQAVAPAHAQITQAPNQTPQPTTKPVTPEPVRQSPIATAPSQPAPIAQATPVETTEQQAQPEPVVQVVSPPQVQNVPPPPEQTQPAEPTPATPAPTREPDSQPVTAPVAQVQSSIAPSSAPVVTQSIPEQSTTNPQVPPPDVSINAEPQIPANPSPATNNPPVSTGMAAPTSEPAAAIPSMPAPAEPMAQPVSATAATPIPSVEPTPPVEPPTQPPQTAPPPDKYREPIPEPPPSMRAALDATHTEPDNNAAPEAPDQTNEKPNQSA